MITVAWAIAIGGFLLTAFVGLILFQHVVTAITQAVR